MNSIFDHIVKYQESVIDYPGKIGLILYVDECNLDCNYCYNINQLQNLEPINIDEIISIVNLSDGFYNSIVICGGEPTLYDDLDKLIEYLRTHIKNRFYLKIDTNGHNIKYLHLADSVAIDYKWPLSLYPTYSLGIPKDLRAILETVGIKFNGEIRTVVTPLHTHEIIDCMVNELYDIRNSVPIIWNINKYFSCQYVRRPSELNENKVDLFELQTYFITQIRSKFK